MASKPLLRRRLWVPETKSKLVRFIRGFEGGCLNMFFNRTIGGILELSGAVAITLAVPCFIVLAYRGWVKRLRSELPRWRSTLGAASLLGLLLSWLGLLIPALLISLFKVQRLPDLWWALAHLMLLAAIPLAFALKGPSRVKSLLAGLLLEVLWRLVMVT